MKHSSLILAASLMALVAVACRPSLRPTRLQGLAQGTYYSIQYVDPQGRNLQPQVDSLLDRFDLSASLWVDSSLLRRINRGEADTVDAVLGALFDYSHQVREYTDGAFDCRVGRLVRAWGFSFSKGEEPDSAMIADLLLHSHADCSIEGNRLLRTDDSTQFDFNAIAQGYSVDLLAEYFDGLGIGSYLIDVGGEVIAHGIKPDGSPWRVGVEKPAADRYDAPEVMVSIPLRDGSVVTSGSYRKYYERDGVRYSHTINPTTGQPVQHSLLSATVVERECWAADAMATAYMVMGLDSARAFIARHPGEMGTGAVFFIYDDHGTLRTYATPAFDSLMNQ